MLVAVGICVTLLIWAIVVVAIAMNLHDAQRAKSLHAQIQTIKDEYKTQLHGIDSRHKAETDHLAQSLLSKQEEMFEMEARYVKKLEVEQHRVKQLTDGLESVSRRRLINSLLRTFLTLRNDLRSVGDAFGTGREPKPLRSGLPSSPDTCGPHHWQLFEFQIKYRQYLHILHAIGFVIHNPDPPYDNSSLPPFKSEGTYSEVCEQLDLHVRALQSYAASLDDEMVKLTNS